MTGLDRELVATQVVMRRNTTQAHATPPQALSKMASSCVGNSDWRVRVPTDRAPPRSPRQPRINGARLAHQQPTEPPGGGGGGHGFQVIRIETFAVTPPHTHTHQRSMLSLCLH